jgi:hypothetical protein
MKKKVLYCSFVYFILLFNGYHKKNEFMLLIVFRVKGKNTGRKLTEKGTNKYEYE